MAADIRALNPDYHDFEVEVATMIREACPPRWQPIATAPRDGTRVRVIRFGDERDGEWWGTYWRVWPWGWHYEPTHWMPLPDLPVVAEATRKADAS